jgi:hypothetical protein
VDRHEAAEGMQDITPDGEVDCLLLQASTPRARTSPGRPASEELKKYEVLKPQEFAAQMMNEPGTGSTWPSLRSRLRSALDRRGQTPQV